jgi:hypothetical protein
LQAGTHQACFSPKTRPDGFDLASGRNLNQNPLRTLAHRIEEFFPNLEEEG